MNTLEHIYQDNEIHFQLGNEKNVMVNATEMGNIFGKLSKDFLKNETTKSFINECLKKENSPYLGIEKEEDLYVSKQKSGTYFHRILALKFAAWLDPSFELWIYTKIEDILFGKAKLVSKKITDEENKKLQIAILIDKVKKIGNEDMNQLLDELDELKKIKAEKRKAMYQFSNQYKMFEN